MPKRATPKMENDVKDEAAVGLRQFYRVSNGPENARRVLFVIATRNKVVEAESLPFFRVGWSRVVYPSDVSVDLVVHFENTSGLPEVYNSELDRCGRDYDLVVFVHDDIVPNDCLLVDKLVSASSFYDLIGIAGGKSWSPSVADASREPVIWTNAAKEGGMSGFVVHSVTRDILRQTNSTGYEGRVLFSTQYGDAPTPTLTLDGCLLCMTSTAIDAGLRFDPTFRFHFYDMDVCFSAFRLGLRTGTCGAICTHMSCGAISDMESFLHTQAEFIRKWF